MSEPVKRRVMLLVAVLLIGAGVGGVVDGLSWSAPDVTPDHLRFGWDEQAAKETAPQIASEMPKFGITDADGLPLSGEGKNQELWKYARLANGGKHIPTLRQESGDCVSMGSTNAKSYLQGFQIGRDGKNQVLKIGFAPYDYGVCRVIIGKRQMGRSPGAVGAWAAKGNQAYGHLPEEEAAKMGFHYSGRLADEWGFKGPPKQAIDYASKFRIRTVSQVSTWEDVRDSIVFGYPVTVASNVGFNGGSYDTDGKRWLRPAGRWNHQMCFVGAEDRPGRKKGCYCLNSWGEDAHPRPLNDEPPGGFWVDQQTVVRMVSQGDSWAFSDFDGFPAPDQPDEIDWNIFKSETIKSQPDQTAAFDAAEKPVPIDQVKEIRKMNALWIGCVLCGIGLIAACYLLPFGRRARLAGSLLLALGLLGSSATLEAGGRRRARLCETQSTYPAAAYRLPAAQAQVAQPRPVEAVTHIFANPMPVTEPSVHSADAVRVDPVTARTVVPVAQPPMAHAAELFGNPMDSTLVAQQGDPSEALFANPMPPEPVQQATVTQSVTCTSDDGVYRYAELRNRPGNFILVIGPRSVARALLGVTSEPVAQEMFLADCAAGIYWIRDDPIQGKMMSPWESTRQNTPPKRMRQVCTPDGCKWIEY